MVKLTLQQKVVRRRLIAIARMGLSTTYGDVAEWAGRNRLSAQGVAADILNPITHYDHQHGRPMLSALVVNAKTKKPGDGFWILAGILSLFKVGEDHYRFWMSERARVRNYWNQRQP